MVTDAEILDAIGEVARALLGHEGPLPPEANLVEALRLDSLRLVTLAVGVEDRFQVRLEPEDETQLATVGDLVTTVRRKLSEKEPA